MSELKAFVARKIDDGTCDPVPCVEVYLKSEADKVIAQHKYKRCLDMVAYCDLKMSYWAIREIHEGDTGKFDLYSKWHERWLELAEKFKEVK